VAAAARQARIAPAKRVLMGILPLIGSLRAGAVSTTIGCFRNAPEIDEEPTSGREAHAAGFLDHSSNLESPIHPADLSQLDRLWQRGHDADWPVVVDQLRYLFRQLQLVPSDRVGRH
jgi:hypothetical protein